MTLTTASCPRCGTAAAGEASRCESCGFVFFELPPRRSWPRPRARWTAVALLALAACVAGVVLLTRDPAPEPAAPVPAERAERRLERQVAAAVEEFVRCSGPIRRDRSTRCQFIYPDGDTRLMLVRLSEDGELDIEVPYPAQRRPADPAR